MRNLKNSYIPILFFTLYFFVGLFIFKDYGLGWDEGICIRSGIINYIEINRKCNYIFISKEKVDNLVKKSGFEDCISSLDKFKDKHYGSINELILLAPSIIFKSYNDSQSLIYIRHFMIFLIFWFSAIFFYKMLYYRYKNITVSLIGCSLLILSPRIFAESFYNSKDLVFLSFTIFAIFTSLKFFEKKNLKYAIIHGLFSALLIDIRIPGIFIPALTIVFFIFIVAKEPKELKYRKFSSLFYYFGFLIIFIIIFWPYLWNVDPISRFSEAFNIMSKYPYFPDMRYLGRLINASVLPWHYSIVWILITTPIIISVLFIIGLGIMIKKSLFFRNLITDDNLIMDIFLFLCFLFPLLTVILLNSTLYNSWRQLYFVYPGFVFTSVLGLYSLLNMKDNKIFKFIILSIVVLFISNAAIQMIAMHPFQMFYFNMLAGKSPENNFDIDYWGLSYREGLQRLIDKEKNADSIFIYETEFTPITRSLRLIDKPDRGKIVISDFNKSDYFITNYCDFFDSKENFLRRYHISRNQEIDSICANEIKVLSIFKLNKNNYIDSTVKVRILNDSIRTLNF